MPKVKTRRGAAKRFKLTAKGKVKRNHSHIGHNKNKKSAKQKRNLRTTALVDSSDIRRVRRMLNV